MASTSNSWHSSRFWHCDDYILFQQQPTKQHFPVKKLPFVSSKSLHALLSIRGGGDTSSPSTPLSSNFEKNESTVVVGVAAAAGAEQHNVLHDNGPNLTDSSSSNSSFSSDHVQAATMTTTDTPTPLASPPMTSSSSSSSSSSKKRKSATTKRRKSESVQREVSDDRKSASTTITMPTASKAKRTTSLPTVVETTTTTTHTILTDEDEEEEEGDNDDDRNVDKDEKDTRTSGDFSVTEPDEDLAAEALAKVLGVDIPDNIIEQADNGETEPKDGQEIGATHSLEMSPAAAAEIATSSDGDEASVLADGTTESNGNDLVSSTSSSTAIEYPLTEEEMDMLREQSSQERAHGKALHDEGKYEQASLAFETAGNLLLPTLSQNKQSSADVYHQDFCTCRLHQALCVLKSQRNYSQAVAACTDVVELDSDAVAPALRARAYHRRAKALLELGQETAALADARSAAFLGDRKAVALYGKLMREAGGGEGEALDGMESSNGLNPLASFPDFMGASSSRTPSSSYSSPFGDLAASSSLLESLLNKSPPSPGSSRSSSSISSDDALGSVFSPLSLLNLASGASAGGGSGGGFAGGSLAKSVLQSLSQRLEDEQTQATICRFLQATSGPQLEQLAAMAGVPLPLPQASRVAAVCHGVTPQTIQRMLRFTKRGMYVIQLFRRTNQLIAKYRNIIILILLLAWIKSALLRPIPVNRRLARRAVQEAANAVTGVVATGAL